MSLPNLEYGNFNRLLVSLGLLLVAGAGAGPYFLLKETGVLTISEEELSKLTPIARQTILDRQHLLHDLPGFWLIPATIALVGLSLVGVGSWRLLRKQGMEDEREGLETQRLRTLVLQEQTKDELVALSIDDAEEMLAEEGLAGVDETNEPTNNGEGQPIERDDPERLAERIRSTEEAVLDRFEAQCAGGVEMVRHVKIRGLSNHVVDALLRSSEHSTDALVQIKLLTSVNTARIGESIRQMMELIVRYRKEYADRQVAGIVVLVLEGEADTTARRQATLERVDDLRRQVRGEGILVEVLGAADVQAWVPPAFA